MLSRLPRLVPAPGTCSLASRDWFLRRVYALSPPAIGSCAGYMLSRLPRLVRAQALVAYAEGSTRNSAKLAVWSLFVIHHCL
eukprot:8813376-Pyramimonas_sp.AAC.1